MAEKKTTTMETGPVGTTENSAAIDQAKAEAWVKTTPGSPESLEQAYMASQGGAPGVATPKRRAIWLIVIAVIVAIAVIVTVGLGQNWFGANEQMVMDEDAQLQAQMAE